MSLEELFNTLVRVTDTTPKTVASKNGGKINRYNLPTIIWNHRKMSCYVEYSPITGGAEELIIQLYHQDDENHTQREPQITLWIANLHAIPITSKRDKIKEMGKVFVEYHLNRDLAILNICAHLLQPKKEQYQNFLNVLESPIKRKIPQVIQYSEQYDEQIVKDLVYRICNPLFIN